MKEYWAVSDSQKAFESALEQRGYYLAKGGWRGFVTVDWRGEVYSLSRWLDVKTRALKERLGDPAQLPTVADTIAKTDKRLVERMQSFTAEIRRNSHARMESLLEQKSRMKTRYRDERQILADTQKQRWRQESADRLRG